MGRSTSLPPRFDNPGYGPANDNATKHFIRPLSINKYVILPGVVVGSGEGGHGVVVGSTKTTRNSGHL